MIGGFPGPERPDGLTPVAFLVIRCSKRDVPFSLELAADLTVEGLLVGLDGQEQVGPLLQAPLKIGRLVCRASAWISLPSRSIVLNSSLSAARSLDAWVS